MSILSHPSQPEKALRENLCIQINYRSNWNQSICLKSFMYVVKKKIKLNCWQFKGDPSLTAVVQHLRASCCSTEPSVGTHLLSKTPAQLPTSEQHDCSTETVKVPQQGKIQKQLKRKVTFSQVFFFKGGKVSQSPVLSSVHFQAPL